MTPKNTPARQSPNKAPKPPENVSKPAQNASKDAPKQAGQQADTTSNTHHLADGATGKMPINTTGMSIPPMNAPAPRPVQEANGDLTLELTVPELYVGPVRQRCEDTQKDFQDFCQEGFESWLQFNMS